MQHSSYELYFLGHPFGKLFDLFVPPRLYSKFDKPVLKLLFGICLAESFEPGQIHRLVTYLHFLVQPPLLGKIANIGYIFLFDRSTIEKHLTRIGHGYLVHDPDKGRFSCTIGAKQTKDRPPGYRD
ncbi:hypothetical protein SDC9_90220 [bioreactor metagenome]|uniref:Uncharacterized protein n=1 Tax=bioreactor metagenome TaxID=1076179 RepID=A0A644ZY29_9ZZZZ